MNRRRLGLIVALLTIVVAAGWALQRRAATPAARVAAPAVATPPVQLAQADLLTARQLELARVQEFNGNLEAVRSAYIKARVAGEILEVGAREGEAVRAGQVLVRIDPTELDWRQRQAEQNAQASAAQLDIARRALANSRALVGQGFVSPTTLDTALANEAAAQATLQAAQAAVELARKARADATLLAPFDGIVAQRLAQPGERIGIDGRVLELVDLSRLEIEAAVPPEVAPSIRPGAGATLQIDGLAQPLQARVERLNPSAQAGSRAVLVYLSVAPHPALRHGLFARGRIVLETRQTLALPVSAVRIDLARPYLLEVVATPDGTLQVAQRPVTLGPRGWHGGVEMVEIVGGVEAGARVLAERAGLLRQGTPVTLAAAPPAR